MRLFGKAKPEAKTRNDSELWSELPLGSFMVWREDALAFVFYFRTRLGYDIPGPMSIGPISDRDRSTLLRRAHREWVRHCDYHGMKYDLDEHPTGRRRDLASTNGEFR